MRSLPAKPKKGLKYTYEAVALGSAGGLIGDNDGLEDLAVLLKVLSHGLLWSLPGESSHKHLGQRGVPKLSVKAKVVAVAVAVVGGHLWHCFLMEDRRRAIDDDIYI